MKFKRASGVLLHPTSLPGPYGIGDLGPAAFAFVDFLAEAGCRLWQVLPLGPTGYGDSPYQCFSAFAGNPLLISPQALLAADLLTADDLRHPPSFPPDRVAYGEVIPWKQALLAKAWERFTARENHPLQPAFDRFIQENAHWLDDFALFMALKAAHNGAPWTDWPAPLRQRQPEALAQARRQLASSVARYRFAQFLFFHQWQALIRHAHGRGVHIIGDMPIFVAHDSADVWAHPHLFYLDENGQPTVVAGVPPDYFSPTGQRWGNPLYRWEAHKKEGYAWWLARFRALLQLVDIIRLDHFRGFAGYWEVPAQAPTAEHGRWVPGPGADFFAALQEALGNLPIIAEDLGEITPDVIALREQFHLPGMKILQFAFSGPENPFLPHHFTPHCVAYTGTHDNDTALGWYWSAPEHEKDYARRYLSVSGEDFAWDLIRMAWRSTAVFALAPMQDLLSLGSEARMNLPGRAAGNWAWRMPADALQPAIRDRLRELNYLYHR